MPPIDIANLGAEERLCLLEELWDSLRATPEAIPLTNAQREELAGGAYVPLFGMYAIREGPTVAGPAAADPDSP
ncbi:MAG TPA: addiction module protein [Terriglobia bacterium]|nr:addiction module protein [Terriglobia bacterium]